MIICLCERVSDRKIRRAIDSGAQTIDEVAAVCRAGSTCMGCHPEIDSLLSDTPVGVRVALA